MGSAVPRESVFELALVEVAVVLDASHAQALHARAIDRALPPGELLEREVVALENLVDRQQPAVDRGDDLGLAADDPALGGGRRQVGNRQRLAERANHLCRTDFLVLDHYFLMPPGSGPSAAAGAVPAWPLPLPEASRLTSCLPL